MCLSLWFVKAGAGAVLNKKHSPSCLMLKKTSYANVNPNEGVLPKYEADQTTNQTQPEIYELPKNISLAAEILQIICLTVKCSIRHCIHSSIYSLATYINYVALGL